MNSHYDDIIVVTCRVNVNVKKKAKISDIFRCAIQRWVITRHNSTDKWLTNHLSFEAALSNEKNHFALNDAMYRWNYPRYVRVCWLITRHFAIRPPQASQQLRSLVRFEKRRGTEGDGEGLRAKRRERGKLTVRSGEANDDACCRRRADWKRSQR